MERRSGAKGNAGTATHMRRTQSRKACHRGCRVRKSCKQRKKEQFTALFHLRQSALEAAFLSLSRESGRRSDGIRWMDYAGNMKNNITESAPESHQGSYRAQPRKTSLHPKKRMENNARSASPRWRTRSSSMRWVKILNAVYENDFMGFSYGFRPGRSQYDVLDALYTGAGTH